MKTIKNIVLIGLIFIVALLAAIIIYVQYNQDKIKTEILAAINQELVKKVEVKEVDFSLIDNFPDVSLHFKDILIYDEKDTLTQLSKLSAKFNLIDIYYGNYNLLGLDLNGGKINLIVSENYSNYIIWKTKSSSKNTFNIDVRNLRMENVLFSIDVLERRHKVEIEKAKLNGKKKDDYLKFSLSGQFDDISLGFKVPYKYDNPFELEINGNWDNKNKVLSFSKSKADIASINTTLNGTISFSKNTDFDLNFSLKSVEPKKLKPFVKENIYSNFEKYNASGTFDFEGSVKGPILENKPPKIEVNYILNKGKWGIDNSLLNVDYSRGMLTNNKGNYSLIIDSLRGDYSNMLFNAKGEIVDFNDPLYIADISYTAKIESLTKLIKMDSLWDISGEINGTASLKGKFDKVKEYSYLEWNRFKQKADFEVRNLKVLYGEQTIADKTYAAFSIGKNELSIDSIKGIIQKQELEANLNITNFYALSKTADEAIISGDLYSPSLNVDELIDWPVNSSNESNWTPKVYLEIQADALEFKGTKAKDVNAQLLIRDKQLFIRNAELKAFGGDLKGDLRYDYGENVSLSSELVGRNVDINEVFKNYNNFGQTTLTSEHISGKANIEVDFYSNFDSNNDIILSSIVSNSNVLIAKGRLKDFEPIYQLSKYVELEELKDIRFDTLRNQILIKNEEIYIPSFNIKNSALDIVMEGKHGFNNQVDYGFTLYLNDLLGKKVKRNQNEDMGYIEDDGLGRSRMFIRMEGDLNAPEFKYDKRGLKKHWSKEIKEEKKEIKTILKKEFGLFKKDTSLNVNEIDADKKKDPFIIEWEENAEEDSKQKEHNKKEEKKSSKKGKLGKFIDKIAKPNEEEYVNPPQ